MERQDVSLIMLEKVCKNAIFKFKKRGILNTKFIKILLIDWKHFRVHRGTSLILKLELIFIFERKVRKDFLSLFKIF